MLEQGQKRRVPIASRAVLVVLLRCIQVEEAIGRFIRWVQQAWGLEASPLGREFAARKQIQVQITERMKL